MKVYVLSRVCHLDIGEYSNDIIGVYQDLEKAKGDFEKEIEQARKDIVDSNVNETTEEKTENTFSIYESGEYSYNHIDVSLNEMELQ